MCFAGERRSDRTSTIRIVFYLFGSIAGFRPSVRWLQLSAGDHHSLAPCWVSGVLALAIPQPCWQTEGLGRWHIRADRWGEACCRCRSPLTIVL